MNCIFVTVLTVSDCGTKSQQAGTVYGIGPGCPNYVERVESALLSYGADTDSETNPFEVGLGKLVNLDRPENFIGKAALTRIARQGLKRRQVGLFLDGAQISPNPHPYPIMHNAKQVGTMSVSAYSPRCKANIAIGMVANSIPDTATDLVVEAPDGPRNAHITGLPFC